MPLGTIQVVDRFTETLPLDRFALYVFDYGAPVGFRLALAHPERVTALISQNGNAYEDGLSAAWNPLQAYWRDPTPAHRAALRAFLNPEATRSQYLQGVPDPALVAPESFTLDQLFLDRPGNEEIQLDLFGDYASNVKLYPSFQAYLRTHRPPTLVVWGRHDPFFLPAGAEAFRRDNPGPRCTCSRPATSRSRRTRARSRGSSATSSPVSWRRGLQTGRCPPRRQPRRRRSNALQRRAAHQAHRRLGQGFVWAHPGRI